MTASRVITRPAGTATPLASGGLLVDMGDQWPLWVPDRAEAYRVLDRREYELRGRRAGT